MFEVHELDVSFPSALKLVLSNLFIDVDKSRIYCLFIKLETNFMKLTFLTFKTWILW